MVPTGVRGVQPSAAGRGWHPKPGSRRSFAAARRGERGSWVIRWEEHQHLFLQRAQLHWVEVVVYANFFGRDIQR